MLLNRDFLFIWKIFASHLYICVVINYPYVEKEEKDAKCSLDFCCYALIFFFF